MYYEFGSILQDAAGNNGDDRKENLELVKDRLMAVPEAQAFSRLSRSELNAQMERGELVFCQLGRRRLIPRRAL